MTSRLEHIFLERLFGKLPPETMAIVLKEFRQARLALMIEQNDEMIRELEEMGKEVFPEKSTKINSPVLEIESSGHITG